MAQPCLSAAQPPGAQLASRLGGNNHTKYENSRVLDDPKARAEFRRIFDSILWTGRAKSRPSILVHPPPAHGSQTRFSSELRPSYDVRLSKIGSCAARPILRLLDVASPDVGSRRTGLDTVVGPGITSLVSRCRKTALLCAVVPAKLYFHSSYLLQD